MSDIEFPPVESNNNNYLPYYRRLVALKEHENYKEWPQEVKDGIDHVIKLIDARENYIEHTSTGPGSVLAEISKFTKTADWAELHRNGKTQYFLPSVMLTGHIEGMYSKMSLLLLS